jgi:hypothetical protein
LGGGWCQCGLRLEERKHNMQLWQLTLTFSSGFISGRGRGDVAGNCKRTMESAEKETGKETNIRLRDYEAHRCEPHLYEKRMKEACV